jgi:hypothetical protein
MHSKVQKHDEFDARRTKIATGTCAHKRTHEFNKHTSKYVNVYVQIHNTYVTIHQNYVNTIEHIRKHT